MATPENNVVVEEDVVENEQVKGKKEQVKENSPKDKKQKKAKKQKEHKVSKVKETVSELKKVSWPKFGKVVKQTLVVIGMVIFFTLVLFAIDQLLGLAYKPLVDAIKQNAK